MTILLETGIISSGSRLHAGKILLAGHQPATRAPRLEVRP